ncbi:27771_t:CDS:1, partial [Dentiscutata erythropus]
MSVNSTQSIFHIRLYCIFLHNNKIHDAQSDCCFGYLLAPNT